MLVGRGCYVIVFRFVLPPNANPWWRLRHSSVLLGQTSSEIPENDVHEEAEILALVYQCMFEGWVGHAALAMKTSSKCTLQSTCNK